MDLIVELRNKIVKHNEPASQLLIGYDVWNYLVADNFDSILNFLSMNTVDVARNGNIGSLLGMNLWVDSFRNNPVLQPYEIICIGGTNHGYCKLDTNGLVRSIHLDGNTFSIGKLNQ